MKCRSCRKGHEWVDFVFFTSKRDHFPFVNVRSIICSLIKSEKSHAFSPPCCIAYNVEYCFYALATLSYF